MGYLDDLLGLPPGTLDQTARDIIPGYTEIAGYGSDVLGIDKVGTPPILPSSSSGLSASDVAGLLQSAGQNIYEHALGGGSSIGGGATMDWSSMGVPNGLTLSGPRRIMPYMGGMIPSGYRVAKRNARAPTSGYPAGVYLVPRRSMNPLNPRALMRAERRMGAFTHWVKRHFRIASSAPRRKRGRFTKRRK